MKVNYDIMFPTISDLNRLRRDYSKTMQKYKECGYAVPNLSLTLIKEMYNQRHTQELEEQYKAGNETVSSLCEGRIDALSMLTQIKLLNTAMDIFKKGDETDNLRLSFFNGKPDEETRAFLNLTDRTGEPINITRTDSLSLPKSFENPAARDEMHFQIFRDGEIHSGMTNGVETVFQNLQSTRYYPTEDAAEQS